MNRSTQGTHTVHTLRRNTYIMVALAQDNNVGL